MAKNSAARKIISAVYDAMTEAEIKTDPQGCMERAMAAARAGLGLPSPAKPKETPDAA